jgi:hypothetical protein
MLLHHQLLHLSLHALHPWLGSPDSIGTQRGNALGNGGHCKPESSRAMVISMHVVQQTVWFVTYKRIGQ